MNNYARGCLIFLLLILLMITGMVAWYYWRKDKNQKQAQADQVTFSRACDTVRLITEKPSIVLQNFDTYEIARLRYILVRNRIIIKDTIVRNEVNPADGHFYTELPFERFLKSDTIVVETQSKHKKHFLLSGFRLYAYLHYGMMGYLGSYDCRFDQDNFTVNGKKSNGILLKQDGIPGSFLP